MTQDRSDLVIYLLHVDAVACAAENETCFHGFGETAGLDG